ncbi:helix-turn-helix transcriptional regulator [Spongorhabdus nitratireducens]
MKSDSAVMANSNNNTLSRTVWSSGINTSRNLDEIRSDIAKTFCDLGFNSVSYQGAPYRLAEDLSSAPEARLFSLRHLARARSVLHTCEMDPELTEVYLEKFATLDPNFIPTIRFDWPRVQLTRRQGNSPLARLSAYMKTLGVKSRITWPMRAFTGEYWCGLFSLTSDMETCDLNNYVKSIGHQLHHLLMLYHLELQSSHSQHFNPYLNSDVICPNAMKTLEGVSRGKSSKQMADILSLTERGVEYHIERLKQQLGAGNRQNLIHIAHKLGLV